MKPTEAELEAVATAYDETYRHYCATAEPGCVPYRLQVAQRMFDAIATLVLERAARECEYEPTSMAPGSWFAKRIRALKGER